MNVQTSVDKPASEYAKYHKRSGRTYIYTPGSLWSHLKYGLGTLAVIVIPTLIPGATKNGLIMGYVGMLVGVVGLVCVWGIVRSLKPEGGVVDLTTLEPASGAASEMAPDGV